MPQDTRRTPASLPTAKPLTRALPLNGGITRRMGETCKRFGKNSGICRIVAGAGIRFFVCGVALSVGHFRRRCRLKRPGGDAAAFPSINIFAGSVRGGFSRAAADLFALIKNTAINRLKTNVPARSGGTRSGRFPAGLFALPFRFAP
ncbi:Periplasmic binding protein [Neisseria lactamica]|nr:hypothetical protein DR91_1743 [Neisseria lactamica ATCC 23970]VTQ47607.1 Periplasmic binding protein [Neisseria lactamica]